eukprot:5917468-Pleurochrysis_carterae.AAC.1
MKTRSPGLGRAGAGRRRRACCEGGGGREAAASTSALGGGQEEADTTPRSAADGAGVEAEASTDAARAS